MVGAQPLTTRAIKLVSEFRKHSAGKDYGNNPVAVVEVATELIKAALESQNGEIVVLVASWVTALIGKGSSYDHNLLCSSLTAVGEMDTGWRMPQTTGIAVLKALLKTKDSDDEEHGSSHPAELQCLRMLCLNDGSPLELSLDALWHVVEDVFDDECPTEKRYSEKQVPAYVTTTTDLLAAAPNFYISCQHRSIDLTPCSTLRIILLQLVSKIQRQTTNQRRIFTKEDSGETMKRAAQDVMFAGLFHEDHLVGFSSAFGIAEAKRNMPSSPPEREKNANDVISTISPTHETIVERKPGMTNRACYQFQVFDELKRDLFSPSVIALLPILLDGYIVATQALLNKQARQNQRGSIKKEKDITPHTNVSGRFFSRDNKQVLASKKRQFGMWMCLSDVACESLSKSALHDDEEQLHRGLSACLLLLTNLVKSVSYRPSEDVGGVQLQALSRHTEQLLSYGEKHKKFLAVVIRCLDYCLRLNHVLVHTRLKRIILMCFSQPVLNQNALTLIKSIVSTYARLRQLTHLIPIYCSALEEATSYCIFSFPCPCRNRNIFNGEDGEELRTELHRDIILSWKEAFSLTPELNVIKVWSLLSEAVCKDYCECLMVRSETPFKPATNDPICHSAALDLLGVLTESMKLSSRIAHKIYDLAEQLITNDLGPALLGTMSVLQETSRKRKRPVFEDDVDGGTTTLIEFIEVCCAGLSLYVRLLGFIERCKTWTSFNDRKSCYAPPLPLLQYIQLANSYLERMARDMLNLDPRDSTRKDAIKHLNLVRRTLQEVSLQGAFCNENDARDLVKLSYALNDGEISWAYNTWEISSQTIAQWAPLADEIHVNSFIDSLVIGAVKEMQQCRNKHPFRFEVSKYLALLSDACIFEIENLSSRLLPRIIFKAEELIRDDFDSHLNTACCLWMIAEQLPIPCCVNKSSYLTLWDTLLSLENTVAASETGRAAETMTQTTMHFWRCIWKLCSKLSVLVEGTVREGDGTLCAAVSHLLHIVHRIEHAKYEVALDVVGIGLVESLTRVCLASKSTHGSEVVFQLLSYSFSRLNNLKAAATLEVDELSSLQGGVPSVVEGLTKAIVSSLSMCSNSDDTELLGGLARRALHLLVGKQKSQVVVLNNHMSLIGAIFRLAGSVSNDAKAMADWSEWAHYQLHKYFPLGSNSDGSSLIKLDCRETLDVWRTLLCDACQSFYALPSGMGCFQQLASCCISFPSFKFSNGDECPRWFASLTPPLQMGLSTLVALGEEADLRWLFSELCSKLSSPFPDLVLLQCVDLSLRSGTGNGFNSVLMDFYSKLTVCLCRVAEDHCHSISCEGISHHLDLTTSSSGLRLSLLALESLLTRGKCAGIGPQQISCIMGSLAAIAASRRRNPELVRMAADWCAPCASAAATLIQFCYRRVLSCLPVLTSLCNDLIHFCLSDKCDSAGRNALNRLLSGLVTYKDIIRWYAPPILVTYVQRVLDGTNVSPFEHRMIAFTLLDICTQDDIETVPKLLHDSGIDIFQTLYKDYLNKHKYTGSV